MATKKKKKRAVVVAASKEPARRVRGRAREGAAFPVAPARAELPGNYAATLREIKRRIREERLRVVLTANAAMVLLYWDIGRMILERQKRVGWGAKVIDRLAADLREAYPDMKGLSPRNLKYMRAFAASWPDRSFVQDPLAQITWSQNLALLEKLETREERLWYARAARAHGWSHNVLVLQIQARARERQGKAINNFAATLPPADSDMAAQVFKDPYLFDFLGTADTRREREVGCRPVLEVWTREFSVLATRNRTASPRSPRPRSRCSTPIASRRSASTWASSASIAPTTPACSSAP